MRPSYPSPRRNLELRLKLREEPGIPATLIAYERPNLSRNKESRYRLVEVRDPAAMRAALESVLAVTVVVEKARRLFLHEGVRSISTASSSTSATRTWSGRSYSDLLLGTGA